MHIRMLDLRFRSYNSGYGSQFWGYDLKFGPLDGEVRTKVPLVNVGVRLKAVLVCSGSHPETTRHRLLRRAYCRLCTWRLRYQILQIPTEVDDTRRSTKLFWDHQIEKLRYTTSEDDLGPDLKSTEPHQRNWKFVWLTGG